jgi:hypothetical protein
MTDQLALHSISEAQLTFQPLAQNNERIVNRPTRKQLPSIALAACFVTLLSLGMPHAQAKQQCSVAMPANPHGQWWSYRLVDGRKCWYEGKPMLSKSLLEWPKEASAQPGTSREVKSVSTEKPGRPLDSQAWAPKTFETFEARWRARIELH